MKNNVIAWWSGGIASAVACKWAVDTFKNVRVVFIDTGNEHDDTYRFLKDCERVYGIQIQYARNENYVSIFDVWRKFGSLNTAHGAICSSELKREMRVRVQNLEHDYCQVFGFDKSERKRHDNMRMNYPEVNCVSPLLDLGYTKEMCVTEINSWGIELPVPYRLGYRNNNCFKTGCVQGGIGYWQKIKRETPERFNIMADLEHELTDLKGEPVTILRIERGSERQKFPLFLKKHPDYDYDIGMAKGREPKPLAESNGFCKTENFEQLEEDI